MPPLDFRHGVGGRRQAESGGNRGHAGKSSNTHHFPQGLAVIFISRDTPLDNLQTILKAKGGYRANCIQGKVKSEELNHPYETGRPAFGFHRRKHDQADSSIR
jgi:hypothetical protein